MLRKRLFYLLAVVFAVCLSGCKTENQDSANSTTVRNVILTSPQRPADSYMTTYSGVIEEGKSVNAAFMTGGKIESVAVKEGDRVRKGQLLARLDDTDYALGVSQLQIQYNQVADEKKRLDEMYARHNIAPNDYEKVVAGFKQLGIQLDLAKNKLDYTRLYSPADGYIATQYMESGEMVGAGTPIVKIADDTRLSVSVTLPVSVYVDRDKIGGFTGRASALGDRQIPLEFESFSPDADNNMLYHLKLTVPEEYREGFTPGMNISVSFSTSETDDDLTQVPMRSVFDADGRTYVWLYDASTSQIHRKAVEVIGSPVGKSLMVRGLSPSDRMVEVGVKQLNEGEVVTPVTDENFQ